MLNIGFSVDQNNGLSVVRMNQVCFFDHLLYLFLYLTDGVSFTGRIAEQLHVLSEVVVLLHGGKRDDDRRFGLSLYGNVSHRHAYSDYPVIDAIDFNELSARVFTSRKQGLVNTFSNHTDFPLVAYVNVIDETSEHDVGLFYFLVFRIKSFQRT